MPKVPSFEVVILGTLVLQFPEPVTVPANAPHALRLLADALTRGPDALVRQPRILGGGEDFRGASGTASLFLLSD